MHDPTIYGNIGNCYYMKKDYKTAEKYISKCCDKYVELGDSSTHFYFWKTKQYLPLGASLHQT